jgi:hypothetical protein
MHHSLAVAHVLDLWNSPICRAARSIAPEVSKAGRSLIRKEAGNDSPGLASNEGSLSCLENSFHVFLADVRHRTVEIV